MNRGDSADPRHDHAGDLLVLDLVVDAREGDRELVVGVADVGEVRVDARHRLGRRVDVDVALRLLVLEHGVSSRQDPRSASGLVSQTWPIQLNASFARRWRADAASLRDGGRASAPRLERPPKPELGDYSTNAAMLLARRAARRRARSPSCSREELGGRLGATAERIEVAGPGFLNLFLADRWYREGVAAVLAAGDRLGAPPSPRPSGSTSSSCPRTRPGR